MNLLQGVSGVGIWVRSEDKEARWSQWLLASTQPDSDPYSISISSSSSSAGSEDDEEVPVAMDLDWRITIMLATFDKFK